MLRLLCLAHTCLGAPLLSEAKSHGCQTILLTRERFSHAAWPWDDIDEFYTVDNLDEALPLVCQLANRGGIDMILGLQEHDVERAAFLREFLCLPGISAEVAKRFRDKLCMRELTSKAGVRNPPFVHVLHHPSVHRYSLEFSPPWMLKPRSEAGALGIAQIENQSALWSSVATLGKDAASYLLEQRVCGDVYHVDSLVHQGRVCFSQAHRYAASPFEVWNHGGIFRTASLAHDRP